ALAEEIEESKNRHERGEAQQGPANPDILAAAAEIPVSPEVDRVRRLSHGDGFGGAMPLSSGRRRVDLFAALSRLRTIKAEEAPRSRCRTGRGPSAASRSLPVDPAAEHAAGRDLGQQLVRGRF